MSSLYRAHSLRQPRHGCGCGSKHGSVHRPHRGEAWRIAAAHYTPDLPLDELFLPLHIKRVVGINAISIASLLLVAHAAPANTVRVEDVESPTMRAGLEAANAGRLEAAERFFQTYIAQEDPNSASAYSNLGNVHLQQGRTQVAVQDFSQAIQFAPEAPVPHLNRAIAYEQLGVDAAEEGDMEGASLWWKRALDDCNDAIRSDPKEFAAWFDKGNVQMRVSDYTGALDSFATAADLAPGLAGYRLREATLRFQVGDVAKAKSQLQGLVRKYGTYGEAHAALAAVYWAEGEVDGAEEELARASTCPGGQVWEDGDAVRKITRWPPALYDAYSRLLGMKFR
jgi:tetratricopeptide (TPR) repeat protein